MREKGEMIWRWILRPHLRSTDKKRKSIRLAVNPLMARFMRAKSQDPRIKALEVFLLKPFE